MASERHEFARDLRKQPTRAQDLLCRRLRGSRFRRAKFRRQTPSILERLGLHVVRFINAEVCDDLDFVLVRIYDAMRLPFD